MNGEDDDDQFNPLDRAATGLPPVLGAGCAARFDPEALSDQQGADFAQAAQRLHGAAQDS